MDVSIIIVNYHSEDLIRAAVASVVSKTEGVSYEIIIVDSSPQDGVVSPLASLTCDVPVKYIPMDENRGFGAANNVGFRHATGRYLFCLNPDTLLVNNAVGELCRYMDSHSRCGACGGNLYHEDMTKALSFRRILPGVFWELSEGMNRLPEHILYGRNSRFNHTRRPIKVGYITGADLMLRASLVAEIGGFAPEFFMYFEETDLCCRIRRAGYDVVSVPAAKIIHLEGRTIGTEAVNPRKYGYFAKSRVEYYRKNLTLKQAAKAYRLHLGHLRKETSKAGIRGEVARVHLQSTLEALGSYPELKALLPLES